MALVLKMQIDDKQEHQYIFSTGDDGTIELIPLNVVINGTYQAPEGKAYNLVTVEVPEITLEQLNVQTSGTYTAPSGKAYDVVTVDIPEYVLDALTATENGTFEPESGHVYNRVVVNVPPTEPDIQTKSVTYTANGTYTVNKDAGFDGMSSVTVTVNVPTPTPNLQTKNVTVTQNGTSTITADTGYDGLEEVGLTVNVQGGGGSNDVITGTVTITDTNGYGECWIPMTIPAGKAIAAILVRSRTSSVYNTKSAWHHSLIQWGFIPSVSSETKAKNKQRFTAYYNSATATTYTSEVAKSTSVISEYLSSNLSSVVAYNADFGLGFKVKAEQGNTYGFAINTDVEYIVVLVDNE